MNGMNRQVQQESTAETKLCASAVRIADESQFDVAIQHIRSRFRTGFLRTIGEKFTTSHFERIVVSIASLTDSTRFLRLFSLTEWVRNG
jgi:hypothetical protein